MPVRLVISICHPLLLVSCNDRRGVDYATTLTKALLQVLASYTICSVFFQFPRLNSHSHALNSHSHPIPIPWLILLPFPWESHGTHGIPVFPIPMHTSSLGERSSSPGGRQTHLGSRKRVVVTTSLVLLCDRVTCSISGHMSRRQLPPRASA